MSNLPERLIDDESKKHLETRFKDDLNEKVLVELFKGNDNPDYVEFTEKLLQELNEIDKNIDYKVYSIDDDVAKELEIKASPTLTIGRDKGYKIEYWGAPAGYETAGFIETIIQVSKEESGLSGTTLKDLEYLDNDLTLQSFVTPTCPYCPQSVLQNHKIAIAKKGLVKSVCVEAGENMELSSKFNVSSVPQQNINWDTDTSTVGVQPESTFVDQILTFGSSKYDEMKAKKAEREKEATKLTDNPDNPVKLTDQNFAEAKEKYPFIVVDCWAEWCAPCRMIAPIVDQLASEKQGEIVFGKLDTDKNPKVSSEYGIRSIPTLLVFKNGEKVGQIVGAKPKGALLKEIEKYK